MYALSFVLPITPTIPKYNQRFEDFKKYGLLNIGKNKIRVMLLVENEYTGITHDLITGWPDGVDVRYIITPQKNVHHKYVTYYLGLTSSYICDADWHVRVDDDSSTDVSKLLYYLHAEFDRNEKLHLVAQESAGNCDVLDEYRNVFRRFGVTDNDMKDYNHMFEVSVDSAATLLALKRNWVTRHALVELQRLPTDKLYFADQAYAYLLRLCKIHPIITNFMSKEPKIGKYSAVGGGQYTHIHYISHDQEGGRRAAFEQLKMAVDNEC